MTLKPSIKCKKNLKSYACSTDEIKLKGRSNMAEYVRKKFNRTRTRRKLFNTGLPAHDPEIYVA
jgi:hypothetical protein